jgi:hypothetical protein
MSEKTEPKAPINPVYEARVTGYAVQIACSPLGVVLSTENGSFGAAAPEVFAKRCRDIAEALAESEPTS